MFLNQCLFFKSYYSYTIWIYFLSLITPIGNAAEQQNVHDPKLDIALLYDQSGTMKNHMNDNIWGDMEEWIKYYFEGSGANQTQFAVMGCGGQKGDKSQDQTVTPMLYFDNTPGMGTIPKKSNVVGMAGRIIDAHYHVQSGIASGKTDNVGGCVRSTMEKLFQKNKGDREDANNVVFYVSDCELGYKDKQHEETMKQLLGKSAAFLFICVTDPELLTKRHNYSKVMINLVKNKSLIHHFKDRMSLVNALNNVLKTKLVYVTHCKTSGTKKTECAYQSNGDCSKVEYPIILEHPDPPQYANKTGCENKTISCKVSECPVTSVSSATKVSAETDDEKGQNKSKIVGNGTHFGRPGEEKIATTEPDGNGTHVGKPDEKNIETTEPSTSTYIIVGVIIGTVLLILLLVVVLVIVLKKRRKTKKGKAERLDAAKKAEKERGMKVDLADSESSRKTDKSRAKRGKSTNKFEKSSGKIGKSGASNKAGPSKRGKSVSSQKHSKKAIRK